ncbi:hypothetical protein BDP27DRAFT_1434367 [Rhodocollybia butyracea]|uniref:Uncharacterized protein n=1 Tax=Rhodocollybia butyracea TaxID=206335 RepID=A0A9P5P6M6_9AGAR|nr:hypothetical protein BDP27DRAFT_1434367 [Rhodocollybia butyracea]
MDVFSACIRRNPNWISPNPLFNIDNLVTQLDLMLSVSQDLNVLPEKQNVPPNHNTACETAERMPRVKRKKPSTVDSVAFGGGSNSGLKAKRAKKASYCIASGNMLLAYASPDEPQGTEAV